MQITTKNIKLVLDEENKEINMYSNIDGRLIAKNINITARVAKVKHELTTNEVPFTISTCPYCGQLGEGTIYQVEFGEIHSFWKKINLQLEIIVYHNLKHDFITFEAIVTNLEEDDLELEFLSPFETLASRNGGIFVTSEDEGAIIFENGLGATFEYFMRAFPAGEESNSSMMEFIYSNKHIDKNFLIGILSDPHFLTEVNSNDKETKGLILKGNEEKEQRQGIAEFRAQLEFPFPKKIAPKENLTTGAWIIMVDSTTRFEALENYATLIAKYNNIVPWPHDVPHGWNSWCNPYDGYEDYYYSTRIDEGIIIDNMDIAVKKLKKFGLKYWQLDNGYSPGNVMTVDDIDEDRFPNGMKYIAKKIRQKGLIPGIWINPFNVGINSDLFKEHEKDGWFPVPDDSFPVKDEKWRSIDLTHPDVRHWFRHCIRKVVKEWGYKLLKVDFAYMSLAGTEFYDKYATSAENHQIGWRIIREEAGDDVFIFGIGGPVGLHYCHINGERIAFDTMPKWHDKNVPVEMIDLPQTDGSIIVNTRAMIRKYFYQGRLWIHHLDCFSWKPSIPNNETMMLMTTGAMMGGIWKISDPLDKIKDEQFEVFQKMLPIYKPGSRPLDLFERLLPEILHFSYDIPYNTNSIEQNVMALMHWGPNRNLITGTNLPNEKRKIGFRFNRIGGTPLSEYLVFDFWNFKFIGIFKGKYDVELEPRNQQVISIQKKNHVDVPQYLSNNRHITQGLHTVNKINYDNKEIKVDLTLLPNFEHKLYFYLPDSLHYEKSSLDISDKSYESVGKTVQAFLNENCLEVVLKITTSNEDDWQSITSSLKINLT